MNRRDRTATAVRAPTPLSTVTVLGEEQKMAAAGCAIAAPNARRPTRDRAYKLVFLVMGDRQFDKAMNKRDTDLLLCTVGGLPPVAWLIFCHTPDQREYWDDARLIYQRVYAELKSYFLGQPHPYTSADPKLKRLYYLVSKRYIDLYNVLRDGWELIKRKAAEFDIQLSVDTPGEYLVLIIERDCAMSFSQCLNNGEYRPRYEYEMYKLKTKVKQLKSQGRKLTKKEQKEIGKFEKFQKQCQRIVDDNLTTWAFHILYMEACWESRDADILTSVKRFRQTDAALEDHLRSFAHPSQRQRGQRFVNGVRESLS